jgi:hypothetical protein
MYVGFYESIANEPGALLRDIFQFLGVDPAIDMTSFPLEDRIMSGPSEVLPSHLSSTLQSILGIRTQELVAYLKREFGLDPPAEWRTTLAETAPTLSATPKAFSRDNDDGYLARVLSMEETFPSDPRFIAEYHGYNIVFYSGQLYSFAKSLGTLAIPAMDESMLRQLQMEETCIIGNTLPELKERITLHLIERAHSKIQKLENHLRSANEVTSNLANQLSDVIATLQQPSRVRRLLRALVGKGK